MISCESLKISSCRIYKNPLVKYFFTQDTIIVGSPSVGCLKLSSTCLNIAWSCESFIRSKKKVVCFL